MSVTKECQSGNEVSLHLHGVTTQKARAPSIRVKHMVKNRFSAFVTAAQASRATTRSILGTIGEDVGLLGGDGVWDLCNVRTMKGLLRVCAIFAGSAAK